MVVRETGWTWDAIMATTMQQLNATLEDLADRGSKDQQSEF